MLFSITRVALVSMLSCLLGAAGAQERLFGVTGYTGTLEPGPPGSATPTNCDLYELDPATGASLALIAPVTSSAGGAQLQSCTGLAQDPGDGAVYLTRMAIGGLDSELYLLDVSSGVATLIGTIGAGRRVADIAFSAAGELWGFDIQACHLLELDPAGPPAEIASVTLVSACPNSNRGISFDLTDRLYMKDGGSNVYRTSVVTGAVDPGPWPAGSLSITPGIPGNHPNFALSSANGLLYTQVRGGDLFTWSSTTEASASVGFNGLELTGLTFFDPTLACSAPLCGDCNGDSRTDILDALTAARHAAGLITLMGVSFSNCNVTGLIEPAAGAVVDILDALSHAQAAAGLALPLACC